MLTGKTTPTETRITATIPAAKAYEHIHFGVWAGLGTAATDGSQSIAALGIGFVQDIAGEGPTADMPNNGSATYNGNWVATVREADLEGDGDISLVNGDAILVADFGDEEITATLADLAVLSGTIADNEFSGTKAAVRETNTHNLTAGATFTGSFSGGFAGAKAAEAGGVFGFTSKDQKAGEFRGAFGGARD